MARMTGPQNKPQSEGDLTYQIALHRNVLCDTKSIAVLSRLPQSGILLHDFFDGEIPHALTPLMRAPLAVSTLPS
jgi:hypothetical protein